MRQLVVFLASALLGLSCACNFGASAVPTPQSPTVTHASPAPTSAPAPTPIITPPPLSASNPFGLMIGGGNPLEGGRNLDVETRVRLAVEFGVAYFRPWDVSAEDWNGTCGDDACEAAKAAGLKLILTVRNNGKGGPPPRPTTPATDLEAYKRTVGEILDAVLPVVLVVENEDRRGRYGNLHTFYNAAAARSS